MLKLISDYVKKQIKDSYKKDFDDPANNYIFDIQRDEILLMSSSSINRKIGFMKKSIDRRKKQIAKTLKQAAWHEWLDEQVKELIAFAYIELLKRSEQNIYDSLGLKKT